MFPKVWTKRIFCGIIKKKATFFLSLAVPPRRVSIGGSFLRGCVYEKKNLLSHLWKMVIFR